MVSFRVMMQTYEKSVNCHTINTLTIDPGKIWFGDLLQIDYICGYYTKHLDLMTHETAAAIDSIQVTMNAGGMNTINIVLAFVMFGVALGIKPRIFVEVFKKPKSVILGMCCQLILLPAFTCLLAILLSGWISPMMGLGMILVANGVPTEVSDDD